MTRPLSFHLRTHRHSNSTSTSSNPSSHSHSTSSRAQSSSTTVDHPAPNTAPTGRKPATATDASSLVTASRNEIRTNTRHDWTFPVPSHLPAPRVSDFTRYVPRTSDPFSPSPSPSPSPAPAQRYGPPPPPARDPYRFDSPDAVVAESSEGREKRKRREAREEFGYNEGLRVFEGRRDAWTGSKRVRRRGRGIMDRGMGVGVEQTQGQQQLFHQEVLALERKARRRKTPEGARHIPVERLALDDDDDELQSTTPPGSPPQHASHPPTAASTSPLQPPTTTTTTATPAIETLDAPTPSLAPHPEPPAGASDSTPATPSTHTPTTLPARTPSLSPSTSPPQSPALAPSAVALSHPPSPLSSPHSASASTSPSPSPLLPPDLEPLTPLCPPLLPPLHPTRALITPAAYPSIYSRVVVQGTAPRLPIPLPDLVAACVQGWKAEGEWPPRPPAQGPEPLVGRMRRKGLRGGGGEGDGASGLVGGVGRGVRRVLRIVGKGEEEAKRAESREEQEVGIEELIGK